MPRSQIIHTALSTESSLRESVASPIVISPSEDSSGTSSSHQTDHNTMVGAGSVPTACSSSVNSEDYTADDAFLPNLKNSVSRLSVRSIQAMNSSSASITSSEMARIQELEQKRLALRHQRFSLEQRLYEFCGKHAEGAPVEDTKKEVCDWPYKDQVTGLKVIYTGSLNEFDQPHGNGGKLIFADGQVYCGDVRGGLRCGQGRNTWRDGQDYTGEWKSNSRNGRGTHVWPDGRKVSGQWQDGHLNGKVYFSWPNGATYDGLVKKGKKHGRGVHTWSDGRIYSGNFENGKENGFGTLSHPDGVKYRGQFSSGVKEGYGIMLWKTRTYDGEWHENKPQGQGRVVWSNGATYTGQFKQGKYHGLGVYVWPSGKKFVGRWEEGVKNGHGLYTWPNGKKYDGEYKNGLKDGYGRMTWPDGQTYCGGFKQNKRFGRGVQSKADGEIIHCGMWKDDFPVGDNEEAPEHDLQSSENEAIQDDYKVEGKDRAADVVGEEFPIPESVTISFENSLLLHENSIIDTERDICSPNMVAKADDDDDTLDDKYHSSLYHDHSIAAN